MIPVGPGIGDVEFVDKRFAGRDRPLGQMVHTVHGIGQADPMVMNGSCFGELIFDSNAQTLSLPLPDHRTRNGSVKRPDSSLWLPTTDERCERTLGGYVHLFR